jgi:hypothetical protein
MTLEWPQRISMHWHIDMDYQNHMLSAAKYVVLAYVTIRPSVHLIAQCLVLLLGLFS